MSILDKIADNIVKEYGILTVNKGAYPTTEEIRFMVRRVIAEVQQEGDK